MKDRRYIKIWIAALAVTLAVVPLALVLIIAGIEQATRSAGNEKAEEKPPVAVVSSPSQPPDTIPPETIIVTSMPKETPAPEPPEETPEPAPEASPDPPDSLPAAESGGYVNPLTGEEFDAAWNPWDGSLNEYRPWVVSIGNTADAMPLWGIGDADILVEFVVESVATRYLAVFQNISGAGRIGGIRSLRTSGMEIASSFDGIYAHWGGRTYENTVTNGTPVTAYGTIDASALGSRDSSKIAPNNAIVTSGSVLVNGLPDTFRTTHYEGFEHGFNFTDIGTPLDGLHADTVTVKFSDRTAKRTIFSYDIYQGKYNVSQFGTGLVDGNNYKELSFTNVLIIRTDMKFDYNAPGHTYIRTAGTGTGYFINGRKYTEIIWFRSDVLSPYTYYLKDGTPLQLGAGKTYICVVDNNQTPLFT